MQKPRTLIISIRGENPKIARYHPKFRASSHWPAQGFQQKAKRIALHNTLRITPPHVPNLLSKGPLGRETQGPVYAPHRVPARTPRRLSENRLQRLLPVTVFRFFLHYILLGRVCQAVYPQAKNLPLQKFSCPRGFAVIRNSTQPSGHIRALLYRLSPPVLRRPPPLLSASMMGYMCTIAFEQMPCPWAFTGQP